MRVPVVSHAVAIQTCADVLRPMMEDKRANPLVDEIMRMARENPELIGAVG